MLKNKWRYVMAVSAALFLISGCASKTTDESSQDVNTTTKTVQTTDETMSQEDLREIDEPSGDDEGGGNPNVNDSEIVYEFEILVSEKEYYYQNAPIKLDDFISLIEKTDGKVIVYISDNNASRKIYKNLTDKLKEKEIQFEEK